MVKEEIKLISGGKHFHWDKGSEAAEMKRTGKEEGEGREDEMKGKGRGRKVSEKIGKSFKNLTRP